MGTSVIIIVIALVILVLAFVGIFGRFPDNWEWVSIVLAVWGVAMSAPSLLQMTIGQSKLVRDYDRHIREQERSLAIFLKNPPLNKNSIWKILGVKRDAITSLSASFCITENGTKKVMTKPIVHARIFSDDDTTETGSWRVALPPTFSGSTCIIVAMWDEKKKKAIVLGDKIREPLELPTGVYQIEIIFFVEGQQIKDFRNFIVGDKADDLIWVKPPKSTSRKVDSQIK